MDMSAEDEAGFKLSADTTKQIKNLLVRRYAFQAEAWT